MTASPLPSDITDFDAIALSEAIRGKRVSCREVMEATLDRIDRLNPRFNAIVSLRERADLLGEADEADRELAAGRWRGWMHGMPQAIKDLAPCKGLPTTMGSPLFAGVNSEIDAIFVERMRASGAIFIGKTNTPEFGLGSHTYNPVFGPTLNTYDTTKSAGGSSGGAAAALSLRLLPVADGSDYAGSLRNPGAWNNVFGLRPSYGRVPGEGRELFFPSMGVAGPMARNVPDLARLLATMSGPDPRVPYSIPDDPAPLAGDLSMDPKGVRIGWFGDFSGHLPIEPGILDLCRSALTVLEGLGCIVEDASPGFEPERIWQAWKKIRAFQVATNIRPLSSDPAKRAKLKPAVIYEVESNDRLTATDVAEASVERTLWHQAMLRLFERYDYLVLPSAQVWPFPVEWHWPEQIQGRTMDSYHRWMEVVIPATMSGCPTINVPVGFGPNGLPMGMQIIAPLRQELACLRIAHAYDQATGWVRKHRPSV